MRIEPRFHLCGSGALMMDVAHGGFDLRTQQRLWSLCDKEGELRRLPGVANVLLGVNNVAVTFDPLSVSLEGLRESLARAWAESIPFPGEGRLVEVPVRYDGSADFDLQVVADNAGLGVEEVIALHTSVDLRVACIGWVPGFAFMVGLPPRLETPRRATPRVRVPKGSAGIGGAQTGVIPIEVPSGWNLLGRSEVELFSPNRPNPCLLAPSDRVRFVSRGLA